MSAEFPTLAEVLAEHRWQMFNAVCRCKAMEVTHDEHAQHQAEVWREACTIRTAEQLDALPDGSVIRDRDTAILTKDGPWLEPGGGELDPILPALLIWHPDWAQS